MNNSSSSIVSVEIPGGVVTTQNISTVIKPKSNNNSLQFVKIQTPELSKKAVEQIRIAEETKSSKEKIKEVEEEWQSNLLNWKSKRRQQLNHSIEQEPESENIEPGSGRKIKTFAEMIEQRAKSNNRLGAFHLKRYIGSGDDEEAEDELRASEPVARQLFIEHRRQQQVADCEIRSSVEEDSGSHSSEFSGHIPLTTSSTAQQESNKQDTREHQDNLNKLEQLRPQQPQQGYCQQNESPSGKCDNVLHFDSASPISEVADRHSISLVANTIDSEQMNSTLKPGVSPLPITKRDVPLLDVDTRTKEVVSARDDFNNESDNSCYEEDEEEEEHEEEQKHQQRIAFVAKLKQFENLTRPASQAPKLTPVPPRPTENKPPPLSIAPKNTKLPKPVPEHKQAPQPPKLVQIPQSSPVLKPAPDLVQSIQIPQPPPEPRTMIPEQVKVPLAQSECKPRVDEIPVVKQSPSSPKVMQMSQSENEPIHMPPFEPKQIIPVPPPSRPLENHVSLQPKDPRRQNVLQLQKAPSLSIEDKQLSDQMKPLTLNGDQSVHNRLDQVDYMQNNYSMSSPKMREMPSPRVPREHQQLPMKNSLPHTNMSNSTSVNQRKLPTTNANTVKEDKERPPPLQVSGKKRCSSCKEELGRGAAAFVVESLSLVYHTNCFRCSVCHANLSNGFRGVDVRVHAGALHCQNCYSKDGLNYSRV